MAVSDTHHGYLGEKLIHSLRGTLDNILSTPLRIYGKLETHNCDMPDTTWMDYSHSMQNEIGRHSLRDI